MSMAIQQAKVNLAGWIQYATTGSDTVVEFGSMHFDKLRWANCKNKIGIEIYKPYIESATFHECSKIQGDFREFESLISDKDMDCALFIDTLEHITREEAFDLMERVMSKFKRVSLMIPEGHQPMEEDVTGQGGHEWQTHRSSWRVEDLIALGFEESSIVLDPQFHSKQASFDPTDRDVGCLFATWVSKT
jgi:hypothetical protein